MPESRDFRFLAERVELDFHRRRNRFRWKQWLAGCALSALALVWVCWSAVSGQHVDFAAGPCSKSHKMIENDCAQCHEPWTPVERFVTFVKMGKHAEVRSSTNEKCLKCHLGASHYKEDVEKDRPADAPASTAVKCAKCHREHRGREDLWEVADAWCIDCHGDLHNAEHNKVPKDLADPERRPFASRITSFEPSGGHPEFLLYEKLNRKKQAPTVAELPATASDDEKRSADRAGDLVQWFQRELAEHEAATRDPLREPEEHARYQDRARIRFNHALHLRSEYKEHDGKTELVDGIYDETGVLRDYSNKCEACHVIDDEGKYMKPIQYDLHCQKCHPLLFDIDGFPGQSVPHPARGKPNIVRGYLLELYTRLELAKKPGDPSFRQRLAQDIKDRSYLTYTPRLPTDLTAEEADQVAQAEQTAETRVRQIAGNMPRPLSQKMFSDKVPKQALRSLTGPGGCRYCHDVETKSNQEADADYLETVRPQIPERWYTHSFFRHDCHTMVDCRACHRDFSVDADQGTEVSASRSTGDVLLPNIKVCRDCHSATKVAAAWHPTQPLLRGARTNCVECHEYHQTSLEHAPFRGKFNLKLQAFESPSPTVPVPPTDPDPPTDKVQQ